MITIYDSTTGRILRTGTYSDEITLLQLTQGYPYVEGNWSSDQYYIENDQVKEKGFAPFNSLQGYRQYDFDYVSKSWLINLPNTTKAVRNARNTMLSSVDKINPVWFSTLTDEQKSELAAYRQALLNVPQQQGFPETVTWPNQPTWF